MRSPKYRVYAAFIVLMILVAELMAYGALYVARPLLDEPVRTTRGIYREQSDYIRRWLAYEGRGRDMIDADVGWRYRPGFRNAANQINLQGVRANKEYDRAPAPGIRRVAAFGDSFVYGTEVADADAWASLIEAKFPGLEVLNYGVGGYGLDQALLRYRIEGTALAPDVVLVGFVVDDIRRVVNVYQRFASTATGIFTKPRFYLDAERHLHLLPSPIRALEDWQPILDDPAKVIAWGKQDQWYEPLVYENPLYDFSAIVRIATTGWIRFDNRYIDPNRLFLGETFNPSAEAFLLQMAIFRAFVTEARANGAEPIIVFFPSRRELEAERDNRSQAYLPMTDELRRENTNYWDAKDAFAPLLSSSDMNDWFEPGGHYSPLGNRIVADWLAPKLLALPAGAPSD